MKKNASLEHRLRPYIKYFAYAQIALQGLLPAALAFSPAVMASQQPASVSANATTTSHSLLLPNLGATAKTTTPTATSTTSDTEQTLARNAQTMASLASSDDSSGAAQQYLMGQATAQATQEIEKWLNAYGNARVTINTNTSSDSTMDGSSFDFLLPVYNTKDNLTFMQFSTHYQDDDRLIGNVGVGQRFFFPSGWMFGLNGFYDQDLSGSTSRAGVGVETWADNFKFSGNGYFAISDWKSSDELDDYDEKAANGFDLQIDSYLPAYPQLGGELKYEKYFGDNVALFDTDHLQNNPSAVTVGVNYTPIPLVTMAVNYKTGQDSMDDTSFKVDLSYQLGVPWAEQISPDAVALRRSLEGSRLDFVNRNNDIVMQYRKQSVIKLGLPDMVTGEVLTKQALVATINAKHGADHIQWDPSSTLLTAGGQIAKVDVTHYTVTMPPQPGQYHLRGIAYDKEGNSSNAAETLLTANQPAFKTKIEVDKTSLSVDQNATYTLTVTDASGVAQSGAKVAWTKDLGTFVGQPDVTTDAQGHAHAVLTSSQVGTAHVNASVNDGTAVAAPAVSFTADLATATISDLTLAAPTSVAANGTEKLTYTATLQDKDNNLIVGQPISWTTNAGTPASGTSNTDAKGQATFSLTSLVPAAKVTMTATYTPSNSSKTDDNGVFTVDTTGTSVSDLTVNPTTTLPADGKTAFTYSATVTNSEGQTVPGVTVNWTNNSTSATFGQVVGNKLGKRVKATSATSVTGEDGVAKITLVNTIAQSVDVSAQTGTTAAQDKSVTFIADVNTAQIDVSASPANNVAVNDGTSNLSATVKDVYGNVIIGAQVTWDVGSSTTATVTGTPTGTTSTTDNSGVATATLKDSKAETVVAGATTAKGATTTSGTTQVTFVENTSNLKIALAAPSLATVVANGTTTSTLTATVTSGTNSDPVPGATIDWTTQSSLGKATIVSSGVTDANGVATATISDTKAESAQVIASTSVGGSATTSSQAQTVAFTADATTAKVSVVAAPNDNVPADGSSKSILTATVLDANDNPVPSLAIDWGKDKGTLADQVNATGGDGTATASLVDGNVELATVTVTITGGATNSATATVNFVANAATAAITLDADNASPSTAETSTLTATVKDANGHPLSGMDVQLSTDGKGVLGTPSNGSKTATDGTVTVTLTDTNPDAVTVTAKISAGATTTATKKVTFTSAGLASSITLSTPDQAYWTDYDLASANAGSLTATVKDENGTAVSGTTVTYTCAGGCTTDNGANGGKSDSSGQNVVKVASTTAGVTGITIKACITKADSSQACSSETTLPFYNPPVVTPNSFTLLGKNGVLTALPDARLQNGQFQLAATGGDGTFTWASDATSAVTVDATGVATLVDNAAANITVTSLGRKSENLAISKGGSMLYIDMAAGKVPFASAQTSCGADMKSAAEDQAIANDTWGTITDYAAYSGSIVPVVWTNDDVPSPTDTAGSVNLAVKSAEMFPLTKADPNAFAACIR